MSWIGRFRATTRDFVKRNVALLSQSDGLILGRKSYEFFAAVWPSRSGEFPDLMNGIAKYVATTTLEDPEWQNTQLIEGDVPEAVAKLKEQPGKGLIVYGSGDLTEDPDGARPDRRVSPLGPSGRAREGEQLLRGRRGANGPRARRLDRDPVRGCHSHLPRSRISAVLINPVHGRHRGSCDPAGGGALHGQACSRPHGRGEVVAHRDAVPPRSRDQAHPRRRAARGRLSRASPSAMDDGYARNSSLSVSSPKMTRKSIARTVSAHKGNTNTTNTVNRADRREADAEP